VVFPPLKAALGALVQVCANIQVGFDALLKDFPNIPIHRKLPKSRAGPRMPLDAYGE